MTNETTPPPNAGLRTMNGGRALAEMLLAGEIGDGDRVTISAKGNVLTFNGKAPQTAEIAQFEAPVPKRKLN